MSRLKEICENHANLDQLTSVLKHYSVNAQFVAESLLQSFEQKTSEEKNNKETVGSPELIEDLKQYIINI